MAEFYIVEQTGYIIVNDEKDIWDWLQSRKYAETMDRYPNLKIEVIYRDELN